MSGYNKTSGELSKDKASDDEYWSTFRAFFSNNVRRTTTYKNALLKSILDNLDDCENSNKGLLLPIDHIVENVSEYYWRLVINHDLRQMRYNGSAQYSGIEQVLMTASERYSIAKGTPFESIRKSVQNEIYTDVEKIFKRYVFGALYDDLNGLVYAFDLRRQSKVNHLTISLGAYQYMLKYKNTLEKLNYDMWSEATEKMNRDLPRPHSYPSPENIAAEHSNVSLYREILRQEFEV